MDNGHYRTADTALSTYLQTEGFTLIDVVPSPHRFNRGRFEAVFLFEADPKTPEYVRLWETGKAVGDLNLWYHTYRATVAKAKMVVKVAEAPVFQKSFAPHS